MKKLIVSLIFLSIGIASYSQMPLDNLLKKHNKNDVTNISVTKLHSLQSQGNVIILDSREKKEFDVSHIQSAKFIGYSNFSIEEVSNAIPNKDSLIVVYCTLGVRSGNVVTKLQDAGYTNVSNLYGGICEWKNNNYMVFDSNNNETEKIHSYAKHWTKWCKKGTVVYD